MTPAEIVATIYRCLGVSDEMILKNQLQRPVTVVPNGKPIASVPAYAASGKLVDDAFDRRRRVAFEAVVHE